MINLDRAPDRLARVHAQLQHLQLPFTRLAAVDARALTPEQRAALDEPAYRRKHGMSPVLGELGCYLSHVAVMRAFLASDAAFALVLEDDVLLQDSLPAVLQGLMAHPGRWDVVKLSAVHRGTPMPYLEVAPGHQLAVMLSRCTGSSAYLMNRRAAQAYLREPGGLLPMQLPYDHVFDQGWRFGLKVRLVTPQPCGHDAQIESTIGTSAGTARKFPWTQRGSTYAYRLGNEARRLTYGLRETLRERLA
ncbi:MAG: glycosyltransferase family 25 protein [Betaproteobacteria bacterium]|nr:glycosyltransferase family 25 protein [Betaproteobacteria bacterium]